MRNRKILLLTMSCNKVHFKTLLGAVKDTWAKPLLHNKYPNVTWFSYTSCDEKHPNPCVDFEEHMIYVENKDELGYTYSKTRDAYNMVKDIVDFDYVIRTNTSVFVNIDNLIKRVNLMDDNMVMGRYLIMNDKIVKPLGFFFGMTKKYFDYCMDVDDNYLHEKYGYEDEKVDDDTIIAYRLNEIDNVLYMNVENENINILNMYKPYLGCNDINDYPLSTIPNKSKFRLITDTKQVNDYVMIRVRTLHGDDERCSKGQEVLHLYELYDGLNV